MLTLFRGGGTLWISREDAAELEIGDNDWVEAYNRNGVVACRAVGLSPHPRGDLPDVPRQGSPSKRAPDRACAASAAGPTTR